MFDFTLPPANEASVPPEQRGINRDQVRMLVSFKSKSDVIHNRFENIVDFLLPGDVVVINTSRTVNACIQSRLDDGTVINLHLSSLLPADIWIVEIYVPKAANIPLILPEIANGTTIALPGNMFATLHKPYQLGPRRSPESELWLVSFAGPLAIFEYLAEFGSTMQFTHHSQLFPLSCFQTVYATEYGSTEMPSAGRPFSPEVITSLVARGVQIAPLILHSGANSEGHLPPHEEYYSVPQETAALVNAAHADGRRVIAIGSTVVRALETTIDKLGKVHPGEGWTRVVIQPKTIVRSVDGILTGFHEPNASHINLVGNFIQPDRLISIYRQAIDMGYLWHEFGDVNLILP